MTMAPWQKEAAEQHVSDFAAKAATDRQALQVVVKATLHHLEEGFRRMERALELLDPLNLRGTSRPITQNFMEDAQLHIKGLRALYGALTDNEVQKK